MTEICERGKFLFVLVEKTVEKFSERNVLSDHRILDFSQNFFYFFLGQLRMPWEVFHRTVELGNFQGFAPVLPESTVVQVSDAGLDVVL